jgi:hypothetical protein
MNKNRDPNQRLTIVSVGDPPKEVEPAGPSEQLESVLQSEQPGHQLRAALMNTWNAGSKQTRSSFAAQVGPSRGEIEKLQRQVASLKTRNRNLRIRVALTSEIAKLTPQP